MNDSIYKKGEILGKITHTYPDGMVDVDYDGTTLTLPANENEMGYIGKTYGGGGEIKEHDMVTLLVDIGDVKAGTEGTVIHIYPNKSAYEVEFGGGIVVTVLESQLRDYDVYGKKSRSGITPNASIYVVSAINKENENKEEVVSLLVSQQEAEKYKESEEKAILENPNTPYKYTDYRVYEVSDDEIKQGDFILIRNKVIETAHTDMPELFRKSGSDVKKLILAGKLADGDEIKQQRISQIREQKIARIKAFLSHWSDDAQTWDKATDEVPDIHNAIAEYFEDDGYKGHIFVSYGGTLPDDVKESPSKRNTIHKKAIYDLLDKISDKDFEKFYNDYKEMFEQDLAKNGATTKPTTKQLQDLEELAKIGILGRAYDEFTKSGIKIGDTFKGKDYIVVIEDINYKTQHVWVVYATEENYWIPETEGEGRTFREVLEYIDKGLWVKTEKTYRRGGPINRSFTYRHSPVEKWNVEYEWDVDFPVIVSIHVSEKTSSENGDRLSEFKAGDVVYRNYGRYEEYEIINDKKDIWVLQDTRTGATSKWNANNNGGFILKTTPTAIDVHTLSEEEMSKILDAAHTDHMETLMEQSEARHNEFERGGSIEIEEKENAEKYGTVFKEEWDKYNEYKDKIKYATYEIPDKVAVFEGKEQMSVPFFKMYGTTNHIKKAFDFIESRKAIAQTITDAGDSEKYPELVKPHNFEIVAINKDSYADGYRAYEDGGSLEKAAFGTTIHDIKEFYQPGKFYKHKRLGYITKYIGKGPRGKHIYYIVDTAGVQEFQVGDQFTPNEPQKWFDIVDEQTTLQFKANGGKTTTEHYKSEDLIIKPYKDTDRDGNPVTVYSLETKDGLYRSYQDTGSYSYWGNTELTPEDKKVYPHRGYNYMFVSNSLFKEHKEDYTKLLNELISGTNYRGYAGGGPVSIHDIKKGDKILDIKTNQVKTVESVDIWSERQVHDPYVSVWFDDGTMTRYPYLKHHGLKVEKYSNGGEKKYQNGGQFSDGGNIHLYDIPEGSTVYEVKVKDPLYKRGEPGVAESPYLYHFEYDGKNVWWHGDWNSNKHKFSKFKIVPKDRSSEEKEEKVTMTPLQESLSKMRVEGNTVYLPSDHIFSNYAEVKNALIKAGATYKRNSFVFPKDAQPYMDRLLGGEKINLKKQFQYFGTPAKLADKVVRLAEIKKGDKVLEPSAGQGAIVDAVHRVQPDIIVDVFELMEENRDVLLKKNVNFLGDNFVDIPAKYRNYYDVIVANPPFNKNQDIEHIRKMYDCLKPGGRLVSLASTHWKTSSNRKENEFASWISELGAFVEDIPPGEFKESGTGIATCIIVIDKPKNKADGGPVREDFIKLDNGTVFYVDKVPDLALDKRGKMSEHEAIKQGINLVFLKNFESDPSALDIAATEMGDTKQPTEAQVRRAMILKIGYEGFWYSLKAGGESGSDHLYSSSLSMDMEGPDGEDVEKVLIKKYNSDFNKILITEDEIRDIKDKIIKFRKRGKKIRDEKVQSIMQFLVMAEARGKYDVTGGGKKNYTEEFRNRIINMILEITDNENVVREEVHFRVKQHQDELDWMGDKECLYMLDEKYMTPERCKEETQKAKDKARKYIVIWKKLESDLLSRMSHEQAAEDGKEVDPSIPVMDEETYLAIHGASRQDIGDSALHKNRGGASDKVWTKIVDAQAKKDADLIKRRQQLREEYWVKVGQGELRPPTRIEKLIETAQGHPDNESVQAARRLLEKKGISWEKMAKDGQSISAETTANNWWRHTLSMNEQNTFAKKYLQNYEVDALIGSTAQFASADYHYKLITKIWRREGSPAYSEWLDKKYGYGDLTDSDLGMKIYYKTHPEYTGFKEKFTSSHAFNDWAKKAKDGSMIEFVDLNRAISLLKNFDINDLDAFERMQYDDFIKHSSKEQVLQILINNVEGDYSQLSPKLAEIAELQDGKAADGKSVKKQPLVNYVNKSITFLSIEEAKQAKKKLKDFDYSLIWEHGDGDWKEGMPNSMLTDRVMLFGNDVDFKISLNLLGLEYRDVSEYEWIFKTAWESTPNGVPFTDNIHGPHGSAFVIFPLPFHNEDDINRAKAWIRYQRDVVSLKVAGDHEWDDLYKSAYFRDPRTRALKWYQIEQDDKLIRKERKKGTTPKEFVDKFVLPHIGRTEDEMRKKHGEKMYQMANGGGIDIKTPLTLANGGPTGTSNVVKDASTLSLYFQELNKELGDQDKIIVRKLKDNSGINIYTNNWTESDNKNSVNAIHWGKDSANLMTKEQLIQHIEHINKVIPVTTFVELLDLKSKNKLIQDKIYLVTDEQLFYIATSQSGLYGPVEGVNSVNLQDYDITMEDVVTGYGEEDEGEEEERKVSRVFRLSFKANGRFENGALLEEMINGRVRKILSKAAKGKKVSEDPLIKEVEKDGIVSGRFGDAKLSSVVYQYGMKMYQVITDHTKGDEKTIIDVTPDDMGEEAEGDFFYDNGGIAARGKIIRKAGGGTKESEWKKKSGVWTHPLYGNTSLIQRGTPELPFTGIHADAYATKMPDGMEMGFDADMGWLVAYKGRLISIVDLPKEVKVIPFKKLKAKADNGLETETESYYIVRMWDTDEDKRKGVPPEEKKYKTRSEAVSQANHSYHEDNFGIVEVEDENSNRILTLDAYAKNGTEIDNIYKEAKKRYRSTLQNLTDDYEVELAAEPNPDYDRGSHEGTIRIKKHRVRVTSLEEARDKVVQFIQNNDLGSGNWSGGDLYQNGKKVGYVSYNGRVWNNDGTPKKDCHGTPMAFQGTAVATAPNLTDVIGFEEFSNKLPDIESPFVGEEGVIYKAKYDTYAGKMMYFKHGRRGLHSTSVAGAYINYLYDKYGIRFKDLSLEERKQLFGKFANRYKLEMFEEGGPVLVD